jgi:L-fuconolactonase
MTRPGDDAPKPSYFKVLLNQPWLDQVREPALEPDLPIIDPHHHLWDRPEIRYLPPELVADFDGHDVRATVYVEAQAKYRTDGPEAMAPVGEVEFASGVAKASAGGAYGPAQVAAGIVGYAALEQGAGIAPVIEALVEAGEGRLKGLRGHASWSPLGLKLGARSAPEGRLLDPAFREGFALLARHGLAYDSTAFHPQMGDLADLADRFSQTPIIVNHVGLPLLSGPYADRREEVLTHWRAGVEALGRRPNVVFKLGGLGIATFGFGYDRRPRPPTSEELARDMRPFFEPCIAAAGVERCMFEADFPPDKISYGYGIYWNACKRLTGGYSPDERRALFSGTAKRAYGLAVEI